MWELDRNCTDIVDKNTHVLFMGFLVLSFPPKRHACKLIGYAKLPLGVRTVWRKLPNISGIRSGPTVTLTGIKRSLKIKVNSVLIQWQMNNGWRFPVSFSHGYHINTSSYDFMRDVLVLTMHSIRNYSLPDWPYNSSVRKYPSSNEHTLVRFQL